MKAYIGNKVLLLAQPEERENVEGYMVVYSDGSETFLAKEIFEFEFRALEDEEIDLVIDSVNVDLTMEDIENLAEMTKEDWEDTFDITEDVVSADYSVDEELKEGEE